MKTISVTHDGITKIVNVPDVGDTVINSKGKQAKCVRVFMNKYEIYDGFISIAFYAEVFASGKLKVKR